MFIWDKVKKKTSEAKNRRYKKFDIEGVIILQIVIIL